MVEMTVTAFDDGQCYKPEEWLQNQKLTQMLIQDLMTNAMTGGVRSFKFDLYRLLLRAAALEGKILAVRARGSNNIVAVGVAFGPGVDFLGR